MKCSLFLFDFSFSLWLNSDIYMRQRIIDLTKDLVKFRSVAGNAVEKRAVLDYVHNWFETRDFALEKFEHIDAPSLLVNIPGQANKKLLFMVHLDVVSASDELFTVRQEGDKLFGRGVLDNKGMSAALMLLAEKIKESEGVFPDINIIFTTDEEIGGENGAKRLANLEKIKDVDFIIVPDGGDHDRIVYKEKGIINLHLEILGKSAHAARPWLGINPIEKAYDLYRKINDLFAAEDFSDEKHWHPTVALTRLIAGQEFNKIPASAELGINIRFTENYSPEELLEKIKTCFDDSVRVKDIKITPCLVSHENHEHIDNYRKVMETGLGKPISVVGEHGASDAQYFQHLGVPIILHRPAGDGLHAEHEQIDLVSLEKFIDNWKKFLEKFN